MKKVVALIVILLFVGCTTIKYVEVPVVKTDSVVHTEFIHHMDTIYQSEKIVVAGDTVYIDRFKYKERTVYRWKTDSVLKVDSIPYPVEVPVEKIVIKKVVPFWCYGLIVMIVAGIAAFVVMRIKKVKDELLSL